MGIIYYHPSFQFHAAYKSYIKLVYYGN